MKNNKITFLNFIHCFAQEAGDEGQTAPEENLRKRFHQKATAVPAKQKSLKSSLSNDLLGEVSF